MCITAFWNLKQIKKHSHYFQKLSGFIKWKWTFWYVTFYRGVTMINGRFLTNYTRYENKVLSFRKANKMSVRWFQRKDEIHHRGNYLPCKTKLYSVYYKNITHVTPRKPKWSLHDCFLYLLNCSVRLYNYFDHTNIHKRLLSVLTVSCNI